MKQMPLQFGPETERTLAGLEQPEQIEVAPWFQSRVMCRIEAMETGVEARSVWGWTGLWLRPALVVAVVALNVTITIQVFHAVRTVPAPVDSTSNPAAKLAQAYGYQVQEDLWTWSGE